MVGSKRGAMARDKSFRLNINKIWAKGYGDRRQEIVFIGLKNEMNESLIKIN